MRERWLSRRAVLLHIAVVLWVPGCMFAAWWQVTRAFDGNGLSYLYSVEWPIFALLGVYFWWMLLHTDYDTVGLKGMRNQAAATPTDAAPPPRPTVAPVPASSGEEVVEDPELAAYNARLAELAGSGPKTWRNPETVVARRPQ